MTPTRPEHPAGGPEPAGTWPERPAGAGPAVRLFCFPHAGGGAASFRPWHGRLGPGVEVVPVVLPGREARWRQRPYTSMDELVEGVMRELGERFEPPFAFFGHSLGAAVAYELCRRHFAGGGPLRLYLSARRAPHVPARRPPAHRLPRDAFLEHLRMLGGVPPEVMDNRELLDAFLPTLRADFQVNETYAPPRGPALAVPVSALLGEDDPAVGVGEMLCWRDLTTGEFSLRVFSGGHFYPRDGHPELLEAIRHDLARAAACAT